MASKPVVLFVMFQIRDRANGGVNSLLQIIAGLENYRPVILTQMETPLNHRLRTEGFDVRVAPAGLAGKGLLPKLRFQRWAYRQYQYLRPALVHLNDMQALLHTLGAWKLRGVKVVFNVRDVFAPERPYGRHWHLLRWCDRIVALSNDMVAQLRRRLPIGSRRLAGGFLTYVHSIVDFGRFHPLHDIERKNQTKIRLGLPTDVPILLFVAKFSPKKQQLEYIDQVLAEGDRRPPAVTVFVGDYQPRHDEYAARCAAKLSDVPANCYHLAGFTDEVEEYYRLADLVLVPTKREGMARCMIEGMSCGVPGVSFDVASAREILEENECGVVVPQADYSALSRAIKDLLRDTQRRGEMASRCIATARRLFGRQTAVEAYEKIYDDLLG